jgi:hypothetical protein
MANPDAEGGTEARCRISRKTTFRLAAVPTSNEFAYSRPATTSLDALQTELCNLCLMKKIFVHETHCCCEPSLCLGFT